VGKYPEQGLCNSKIPYAQPAAFSVLFSLLAVVE